MRRDRRLTGMGTLSATVSAIQVDFHVSFLVALPATLRKGVQTLQFHKNVP